ncbi:MAG TPA: AAA family ATPase [Acidimicrobiia bacterium]|nr:AAA family ATPase [Acidimicrobiia bacterium]
MASHLEFRTAFIGRIDELAQLRAAYQSARSGKGKLVLLSGPPGIGKSRLAAEITNDVTDAGGRVLTGRSWEAGGAPAYWPWIQAIRGYLRSAGRETLEGQLAGVGADVMTILPELGDQISGPKGDGDPTTDRFLLFDAFSTFLRNVADSEPLVIVLEDLQAADVPTLLLLEFVTNQLADAAILIVASYRDVALTPEHPLTGTLAELHRSPVTTHLTLGGLDADEATRFLEAIAGEELASTFAVALHHQTAGNPLFLGEAAQLITARGSEVATSSMARVMVPPEIRTVIERRLDGLSPECRSLLETTSVLGNEFDVEVAAKVAEVTIDVLLDRMAEAVSAGLVVESLRGVGTFGFAHDLVRQVLYAGLTPSVRIRLHRQAAAVLEATYGESEDDHLAELARHHFEAATGGDHEKAIQYGRRAAEQSLARLAYEEAVRLFEMTVQTLEGSDPSDRASLGQVLLSLGDACVKAGDLQAAGKAFLRAADVARRIGDSRLMGLAAAGYGGRFVWARAGDDKAMVPLLQDALVMLGGEDDALRVRLLSRLACALRSVGDRNYGAALARQALDMARQLDDPETLIYALVGMSGAMWWPENSLERIDMGRELVAIGQKAGLIDGLIYGHTTLCFALTELGDFAAARRELQLAGRAGGSLKLATQRWLDGAMGAVFEISDGHFEQAEPVIDEMLHQPPISPARDNISAALFQLFLVRREQGRLEEITDMVRKAATNFPWYPFHRLALAQLLRSTGSVAEASSLFGELGDGGFSLFQQDNYWVLSLCLASELAVDLGDVELAQTLADLLTPCSGLNAVGFPEGSLGAVDRYLGLLAGFLGDPDGAVQWFERALLLNERNRARPWVAHTHYDLAGALLERGGSSDAVEAQRHLRLALAICEDVGLPVLQSAVESALGANRSTPEPPAETTSALFRREGDYFSIAFNGVDFKIKDSKGMRYLGSLLRSPGKELHVLDLIAGERGVEASVRGIVEARHDDLVVGESSLPVIDRPAREAYERRLADLQDDIAEAERFGDVERVETARTEHDFLVAELSSALGLGGRDRVAASAAERARVNVTRAIRSALAKIDSHDPVLGQHLDTTIRTGVFCSYNPDPLHPVHWDT